MLQHPDWGETYCSFSHHSCLRSRSTRHSAAVLWCTSLRSMQTDQGKLEKKTEDSQDSTQEEVKESSNDRIIWSVCFKCSWIKNWSLHLDGHIETLGLRTVYWVKCCVSYPESLISVGFIWMELHFQGIGGAREHKSTSLPTIPSKIEEGKSG